jgi:multiple sugar transport system substrate-binding protein
VQRKRSTIRLLLLTLFLPPTAGCGPGSQQKLPETEARKFDGVSLRVACPDAVSAEIVRRFAPGWGHRVGAKVEVETYDSGAPARAGREALPPVGADVWVLPAAELPRHAAAGVLAPLPDTFRKDRKVDWRGLLPLYREQLLVWDRAPYGLPLCGDAPLCFYRKDLFRNEKNRGAYRDRHGRDLQPPATWEDYLRIAEFFQQQRKGKPASLPPLPADDRALDALFYAVAAPIVRRAVREDEPAGSRPSNEDLFAFHFDLTGAPHVATPGFVEALRLLQAMRAFCPEKPGREPWQAFRDDDAVLCLDDCRRLNEFQKKGSPVRDLVGVCALPGSGIYYTFAEGQKRSLPGERVNRVPYLGAGAFVLAVPRSGGQMEAAFALVAELGGRSVSQQVVLEPRWGGGIVRSAQVDREHWDAFRLEGDSARELRSSLRQTFEPNIRNPLSCLRLPDERHFVEALVKQLRSALKEKEKIEPSAALADVARAWEQRVGPHKADHLRAYRLSLGLPAQ